MTPDSLPPRPARLGDARLAALITDLRRQQLRCQLLRVSVLGEQDVRLEVCADDAESTVELLWFGSGAPAPPCWHAVRLAGLERAVWRGPARDCPRPVLARFLLDLLRLAEPELERRYVLLG